MNKNEHFSKVSVHIVFLKIYGEWVAFIEIYLCKAEPGDIRWDFSLQLGERVEPAPRRAELKGVKCLRFTDSLPSKVCAGNPGLLADGLV